jgi:hypothetical protein
LDAAGVVSYAQHLPVGIKNYIDVQRRRRPASSPKIDRVIDQLEDADLQVVVANQREKGTLFRSAINDLQLCFVGNPGKIPQPWNLSVVVFRRKYNPSRPPPSLFSSKKRDVFG